MPRNGLIIACFVLLVVLVGIAGLLQTADTDGGNGIVGSSRVEGGSQKSTTGEDPTAFGVTEIQFTAEGGVSLSSSDLGPNFVYTVESTDTMLGRWFMVEPFDQWPTSATNWTDTSPPVSGTRFYRIQTEALYDPPAAPAEVTGEVEGEGVVIRWNPVPGASYYNVYWSTDEKLLPTGATKLEDVSSPFTHSGLDFGVTYYYVVCFWCEAARPTCAVTMDRSSLPIV